MGGPAKTLQARFGKKWAEAGVAGTDLQAPSALRDFGVLALPKPISSRARNHLNSIVRTQAKCSVKTMHSVSALSITAICIVFLCYKPARLSLSLARENLTFKTVREGRGPLVDIPRERWTPELKAALAQRLLSPPASPRIHICQSCPSWCPSVVCNARCNPAMAPDLV
jgi:hypothetical protein